MRTGTLAFNSTGIEFQQHLLCLMFRDVRSFYCQSPRKIRGDVGQAGKVIYLAREFRKCFSSREYRPEYERLKKSLVREEAVGVF